MSEHVCFDVKYPARSIFGKVISIGWYDGTTWGLAECSKCSIVFKYDIVDWDSHQERRIFALSPVNAQDFERIVKLLSRFETPSWPFWFAKFWPSIGVELDECLARAGAPEYLVASDRDLDMVFATKRLSGPERDRLPTKFDGLPVTNDFNYWRDLVGLRE